MARGEVKKGGGKMARGEVPWARIARSTGWRCRRRWPGQAVSQPQRNIHEAQKDGHLD